MLWQARDSTPGGVILAWFVLTALSVVFVVTDIPTTPKIAGPETGLRAGDPECWCRRFLIVAAGVASS
jgi:hypothetical protein